MKLTQKIIYYLYLLLFFLTPFLVSPQSSELFERPKMLFVYAITTIIATIWTIHIAIEKKLIWKKSVLDPILLFILITQFISTIFSIHPETSWHGYYTRLNGGFYSTICYCLLAWGFINFGEKNWIKNIFLTQLAAGSIVSLYAIAEHFGIDSHMWVQDVQNRVFSTLGQPNWLAAWIGILIPITLYFWKKPPKSHWPTVLTLNLIFISISWFVTFLITKEKFPISGSNGSIFTFFLLVSFFIVNKISEKIYQKIANFNQYNFLILFAIFTTTILFTKSRSGIIALFVSLIVYFISDIFYTNYKTLNTKYLLIIITYLFLILLVGTEWTPNIEKLIGNSNKKIKNPISTQINNPQNVLYPETVSDSTDIRKTVWKGSLNILKDYPFFGSGTETYAYSYYQFRPIEHNSLSEWDFLYNKAHNEYLNFLANNGILGTAAIFSLFYAISYLSTKNLSKKYLTLILALTISSTLFYFLSKNLFLKIIQKLLIYPPLLIPFLICSTLAVIFIFLVKKNYKFEIENPKLTSLSLSALASIFITNFYGFSVVNISLIFFLIPAIFIVKNELWQEKEKIFELKNSATFQTGLCFIAITLGIYTLVSIIFYYSADKLFNKSEKYLQAGRLVDSLNFIDQALELNSGQAEYYSQKAEANAQTALILSKKDASDSTGLIELTIKNAQLAAQKTTEKNPVHLNLYKSVVKTYITLGLIDKKYLKNALEILLEAQKLSPTDPQITLNIALLYKQFGKPEQTEEYFKKSVALKPNYRRAWILFADFYKENDQIDKAKEIYNFILKNIDPYDQTSLDNLEKLNYQ